MHGQREFYVVIPARYASSRLPGKALEDIGGVPMVLRAYRQAELSGAVEVLIATDDERIAHVARRAGARVELTSEEHDSGTDRVAEIVERLGWPEDRLVVNVQGDEPLIPPALISQVAELLADEPRASIATLATTFRDAAEFEDPNTAKVVVDKEGFAIYFSRAPIPWPRDGTRAAGSRRHVGLYAYRVAPLLEIANETPCELELIERLEQLRALWLGHRVVVADAVERPPPGVDTPADLAAVRALFEG
jgi:3-deoxy-manno-octulosonate cytidylyltransferase (CMP-KDO synthetase)